jgi:hypothetical protein
MTQQPKRECRNCSKSFQPVHRLMGPREDFNVPEDYEFGPSRVFYCSAICRQSARRRRDRERKAHIGIGEKRFSDDIPGQRQASVSRCRQCRQKRALRFDTFGWALDDHIEISPTFCSAYCLAAWWKTQPGPVIADITILRLMGKWNAASARAEHARIDSMDDEDNFLEWDEEDDKEPSYLG